MIALRQKVHTVIEWRAASSLLLSRQEIVTPFRLVMIIMTIISHSWLSRQYVTVIMATYHDDIVTQQTKCTTFIQCWANVEDVGPTLYECFTNVLCLLESSETETTIYNTEKPNAPSFSTRSGWAFFHFAIPICKSEGLAGRLII